MPMIALACTAGLLLAALLLPVLIFCRRSRSRQAECVYRNVAEKAHASPEDQEITGSFLAGCETRADCTDLTISSDAPVSVPSTPVVVTDSGEEAPVHGTAESCQPSAERSCWSSAVWPALAQACLYDRKPRFRPVILHCPLSF